MMSDTYNNMTSMPVVIPTKTQQITARLVLRNDLGQVVQQWLVRQNKCTLGSSVGCGLRCEFPGIAPYHALLVVGARQIFVRALAPKLTRAGVPVNEILLTEECDSFEIAGHRFELTRGTPETLAEAQCSPQRLKFTLARPFEISNRAGRATPESTTPKIASPERSPFDDRRVAQLLQSAIEPLECRLQNILEPLEELQAESRKQRELSQQLIAERGQFSEQWLERESQIESAQADLPIQLNKLSAKQSAAMDVINERISAVTSQLSSLENIIASEREDTSSRDHLLTLVEKTESQYNAIAQLQSGIASSRNELKLVAEKAEAQSSAITQLQSGMVSVSTAIQDLESRQLSAREEDGSWKQAVQTQISALRQSVESVAARVEDAAVSEESIEEEAAWRLEIQNQFSMLRDFAQKAVERAEAAQLAAEKLETTVEDYVHHNTQQHNTQQRKTEDSDEAWKSDVQNQFESLRTTLETIAAQTQQRSFEPPIGSKPAIQSNDVRELAEPVSHRTSAGPASKLLEGTYSPTVDSETEDIESVDPTDLEQGHSEEDAADLGATAFRSLDHAIAEEKEDSTQPSATVEPLNAMEENANRSPASHEEDNEAVKTDSLPSNYFDEPELDHDDYHVSNTPPAGSFAEEEDQSPQAIEQRSLSADYFNEPLTDDSQFEESSSLPNWWKEETTDDAYPQADSLDVNAYDRPSADDETQSEPAWQAQDTSTEDDVAVDHHPASDYHTSEPNRFEVVSEVNLADSDSQAWNEPSEPESEPELSQVEHAQQLIKKQFDLYASHHEPQKEEEPAEEVHFFGMTESESNESEAEEEEQSLVYSEPLRPAASSASPALSAEEDEDTSVEDYMRSLLARMRGVPENQVEMPKPASSAPVKKPAPSQPSSMTEPQPKSSAGTAKQPDASDSFGSNPAKQFSIEDYVPRVTPPDQLANLAAMRELANSSARTAIHKSTKQRSLTSVLIGLSISCIGLTVGAVLIAINGLSLNIALVATIASFLVAAIWGYDATISLKPLLQAGLVLNLQKNAPAEGPATGEPDDSQE